MIFGEWLYSLLLVTSALVFRFLPGRARPWWLAACGLAFYAYYSQAFVWLVAVEIVVVLVLVRHSRRHLWAYGCALIVAIGLLVAFKYGWLVSRTVSTGFETLSLGRLPTFPQLVLPLAISFFTFEFIHYIVDARAGKIPEHTASEFFAFMLFFPTMVAGPIKRFQGFQPQLGSARVDPQDINDGVTRIVFGFAKKLCIADTLAPLTTPLLSSTAMEAATRTELLGALLAFSVMIYMDFSAYSDIAIGSARLFGIRVPENFDWPYLRDNIAQFWRHWHMSLTSWITDYIYIPLGGSRKGLAMTALNSVLAMSISGLWHGAQWHFLAWGVYNGVLLAIYRVWSVALKPPLRARFAGVHRGPLTRVLGGVGYVAGASVTFSLVTIGWGLFVMPVERFVQMIGRLL